MLPEIKVIACPNCASKNIKKAGVKKNMLQNMQKYYCKQCCKTFTLQSQTKNKTYPARIILNAVSSYNLGRTQTEVSSMISKRFKIKPSQKTISNWTEEYSSICTFHHLREKAKTLCPEKEMIEKHELTHNNLPYIFRFHKAKLELLSKDTGYNNRFTNHDKYYEPLKQYLKKVPTEKFPHHIFQPEASLKKDTAPDGKNEQRASQLKFSCLEMTRLSKNNLANKLASLALNLAKNNRERHEAVQNFMLINDSSTVAVEVPVYLTKDDITYFLSRSFSLPLANQPTPITGHIDILQIRNGLIHVLDYKPEACRINAVNQLTIYALALASRTKLDLKSFKCAWFDEKNYFEFFPLHCVYPKRCDAKQ